MSKSMAQRQRIGPQIRHLRQLRSLTLDDLAGAAGLSASHLSRLERSQTLPSFTVLANIAQVLDVSIDEFVQLEHDLQELDEQLAWQSDLLALDENAYQEILGLSIDTRRQLNQAIELLSDGTMSNIRVQESVAQPFAQGGGFRDSYDEIKRLIVSCGQNGVGLSRSLVQLKDIPGPRSGIFADTGLVMVPPNVEYASVYRGLFPQLPLDPFVARKWSLWHELAADEFPFDWPIKLIVRDDLLDRVRERFDGVDVVDGNKLVADIARYWHRMIQDGGSFQLAVTSQDLGRVNVLASGRAAAMFEQLEGQKEDPSHPVGLWVSGSELVEPIINAIEQTWKSIPDNEKDTAAVRSWLERYFS